MSRDRGYEELYVKSVDVGATLLWIEECGYKLMTVIPHSFNIPRPNEQYNAVGIVETLRIIYKVKREKETSDGN